MFEFDDKLLMLTLGEARLYRRLIGDAFALKASEAWSVNSPVAVINSLVGNLFNGDVLDVVLASELSRVERLHAGIIGPAEISLKDGLIVIDSEVTRVHQRIRLLIEMDVVNEAFEVLSKIGDNCLVRLTLRAPDESFPLHASLSFRSGVRSNELILEQIAVSQTSMCARFINQTKASKKQYRSDEIQISARDNVTKSTSNIFAFAVKATGAENFDRSESVSVSSNSLDATGALYPDDASVELFDKSCVSGRPKPCRMDFEAASSPKGLCLVENDSELHEQASEISRKVTASLGGRIAGIASEATCLSCSDSSPGEVGNLFYLPQDISLIHLIAMTDEAASTSLACANFALRAKAVGSIVELGSFRKVYPSNLSAFTAGLDAIECNQLPLPEPELVEVLQQLKRVKSRNGILTVFVGSELSAPESIAMLASQAVKSFDLVAVTVVSGAGNTKNHFSIEALGFEHEGHVWVGGVQKECPSKENVAFRKIEIQPLDSAKIYNLLDAAKIYNAGFIRALEYLSAADMRFILSWLNRVDDAVCQAWREVS